MRSRVPSSQHGEAAPASCSSALFSRPPSALHATENQVGQGAPTGMISPIDQRRARTTHSTHSTPAHESRRGVQRNTRTAQYRLLLGHRPTSQAGHSRYSHKKPPGSHSASPTRRDKLRCRHILTSVKSDAGPDVQPCVPPDWQSAQHSTCVGRGNERSTSDRADNPQQHAHSTLSTFAEVERLRQLPLLRAPPGCQPDTRL